jgi:hypothetical protein
MEFLMDKLRLSTLGPDFAKLYSGRRGFFGCREAIAFPSNRPLVLVFLAERHYEVRVDGQATLTVVDEEDAREIAQEPDAKHLRMFSVNWTAAAKGTGEGSATMTLTNPDLPDQPFVFALTLGQFAYAPATCVATAQTAPAATETVASLLHHSWFGDLVASPHHWLDLLLPPEKTVITVSALQ